MPAALSRVDSSRINGCPRRTPTRDPDPNERRVPAALGDEAVEPEAIARLQTHERYGDPRRLGHSRT